MTLQPMQIHRINLEFENFDPKNINQQVPDAVIARIMKPHLGTGPNARGTGANTTRYKEHRLSNEDLTSENKRTLKARHRFKIRVFYCRKQIGNKFSNFLIEDGGDRKEFSTFVIHYITFFYRQVWKNMTVEKTVKVWEMFALTTKNGWQAVKKFSDYAFPIKIAKRVIDPNLTSTDTKSLAGPNEATSNFFRQKSRLLFSNEETMGKIFTGFSTHFKENSSVMQLDAFVAERDKGSFVGIKLGIGSLTIRKKLSLKNYCEVLCHFSKIARGMTTTRIVKASKVSAEEEDDPMFGYLENIQLVNENQSSRLNKLLTHQIWEICRDSTFCHHLFFGHRYHRDYHNSTEFKLSCLSDSTTWCYHPTLQKICDQLKNFYGASALSNETEFVEKLKQTSFKFNCGDKKYQPIFEFFQGEYRDKNCTYFRLDGIWYQIKVDHLASIQRDFCALVSSSLSTEVDSNGQLTIPWYTSEASVAFTKREVAEIDEGAVKAFDKLQGEKFRFISEDGTVQSPFVTRIIFSEGNNRSYVLTVKKNWSELNAFLSDHQGKKITAEELHIKVFKGNKKKKAYAEQLFASLQQQRPVCYGIKRTLQGVTILDKKQRPLITQLRDVKLKKLEALTNHIPKWEKFLQSIKQEKADAKDPGIVTQSKITDLIRGLKKSNGASYGKTAEKLSQKVFDFFKECKVHCESEKRAFIITGPLPNWVPKKLKDFLNKQLDAYKLVLDEEGYNRLYLGKKGYLVADQVYGNHTQSKFELFDIFKFTSRKVYFYHVKKGFGSSTREATAQARIAAKLLSVSTSIGSNEVLRNLYSAATKEGNHSLFRQDIKREFETNTEEEFVDLVRKKNRENIVFVYAFALDGTNIRRLSDEISPPHTFTDADFKSENVKKGIVTRLKNKGYLDEDGKLPKGFWRNRESEYLKVFGEREGKAIYRVLMQKVSQFHSIGAKIELLQLAKFLRSCSFGFQICQIPQKRSRFKKEEKLQESKVKLLPSSSSGDSKQNVSQSLQDYVDFGTRYSPEEKIDLLKNMGVSGIENVDRTDCFIIASMQMIIRTPLMGFLRDPKNLISENQTSQLPSQLGGFFLQYAEKSQNNFHTLLFVDCFRDVNPGLRLGQQDAHEFLNYTFLNYDTSTIAAKYTKSYVVEVNESESIPYEKNPSTAELSPDDTYVVEMKKVEELFITLSMDPYRSKKTTPFQTLLNDFEEHNPGQTGVKFNFNNRTYQTDPIKVLQRFYDLKPFLLFMLPRYQSNGNKFSANVDFGDGEATLKGKKYALQAFVIHIGSNRHSGHYVAYGKDKEGQWQFFNDGQTRKVTHEQAIQAARDAYLICLKEVVTIIKQEMEEKKREV